MGEGLKTYLQSGLKFQSTGLLSILECGLKILLQSGLKFQSGMIETLGVTWLLYIW